MVGFAVAAGWVAVLAGGAGFVDAAVVFVVWYLFAAAAVGAAVVSGVAVLGGEVAFVEA